MTVIRALWDRPAAAHRMLIFPHAGGSASFYRSWAANRSDIEVLAVQYPGRADRLSDAFARHVPELVEEIVTGLRPYPEGPPVTLVGHSMGAIVAFETARRLEADEQVVRRLVASGARSPLDPDHVSSPGTAWDDEAAIRSLVAMGQTAPELLADSRVREFLLPHLRADFELFQRYAYSPGPPLRCEVLAVHGDDDPHITAAKGALWQPLTEREFAHFVLPGGHFYFGTEPPIELFMGDLKPLAASTR